MNHDDCKAKADAKWLVAHEALSYELKRWQHLADSNSEAILNIDNRLMPSPFGDSDEWRSLFAELKTTLSILSNQFAWYEDLITNDMDLKKKGKNNEDA